jgi:benzodiazapine receptor
MADLDDARMTESSQAPPVAPGGQWIGLLVCLGVTAVAAAAGAIASAKAAAFYTLLSKPDWAPSPLLFGPVWTMLYILMAIAAWLVWRQDGLSGAKGPLVLYVIQLALNALWTWLFFRWRQGEAAIVEIIVLWLFVLLTLVIFWRRNILAGILLLPYWAWVTFATALTMEVWRRNASVL